MEEMKDPKQEQTKSYEGVKGWLLFFCLVLIVISPIVNTYYLHKFWKMYHPVFQVLTAIKVDFIIHVAVSAFLGIFGIYAGIHLMRRMKNAVKIAKIFLVAMLIGGIAVAIIDFGIIVAVLGLRSPLAANAFAALLMGTIKPLVFFLVWNTYLNHSMRVKATYT